MFVAKCIQDGRRVDLPLSAPFFKFMCTPGVGGRVDSSSDSTKELPLGGGGDISPTTAPKNQSVLLNDNDVDDRESNRSFEQLENLNQNQNQISGSGGVGSENEHNNSGASSRQRAQFGGSSGVTDGEAGLKEAELVLSTEISKDGSPKDKVLLNTEGEGPWFEGIMKRGDLEEVNPYRCRFLKQLEVLVKQRDEIQGNQRLRSLEKERQLAGLTLPGSEENIPGAKLGDLW